MDYPRIGVVGKPFNTQGKMDYDWNNYYAVSGLITNLVNEKGGISASITPATAENSSRTEDGYSDYELTDEEKAKIDAQIDELDGIILQGGIQTLAHEQYIAKRAMEKKIPIMGICAGFNNIIRAAGGKTIKSETDEHDQIPDEIAHTIIIEKDSNLYKLMDGEEEIGVNSIHTIIARQEDMPDILNVTAKSPDGLVEAYEGKNSPIFGYKFHPELMATKDAKCYNPKMENIFSDFNEKCLEYKREKEQAKIDEIEALKKAIVNKDNEINTLAQNNKKLQYMLDRVLKFAEKVKNSRFAKFFFRKELKALSEPDKEEKDGLEL